MSMEELLGGFPVEQFVPALVELLNYEHNPDMMLLATRALSYMMESIPKSAKSIINNNAVPIFCAKLMFIQYIDVAEQTLQILGKLSVKHSHDVLLAGGLMAVLTYLDFFGMSVQRSCVSTAANLCRNVPPNNFELVSSVLPLLSGLLIRDDPKSNYFLEFIFLGTYYLLFILLIFLVVESGILCFQRLVNSFKNNAEHIEVIAAEGLVTHCLQLLSGAAPVGL